MDQYFRNFLCTCNSFVTAPSQIYNDNHDSLLHGECGMPEHACLYYWNFVLLLQLFLEESILDSFGSEVSYR